MRLASVVLCWFVLGLSAPAQDAGSHGGLDPAPKLVRNPPPDSVTAERVITVEGVAEVRVNATEMRLVFAVAVAATTAAECQKSGDQRVRALLDALAPAGVKPDATDVDFIAILPVYVWEVEDRSGKRVMAEKQSGFRLQDNVHVRVPDEATARMALKAACTVEGVELLTVDYWNADIQKSRQEAQKQALAEARRKADVLLSVFDTRPAPINVHESTTVIYPKNLYETFQRANEASSWYREDLPRLAAPRPLNTYYKGFFDNVDVMPSGMPAHPQISVVSKVSIYFAAPLRPEIRLGPVQGR
jgi:uncharacterized protein YggE